MTGDRSASTYVELARSTIDANTDAGPGQGGVHTMGAAVRAADGRMFAGVNLYHFTVLGTEPSRVHVNAGSIGPRRWTPMASWADGR